MSVLRGYTFKYKFADGEIYGSIIAESVDHAKRALVWDDPVWISAEYVGEMTAASMDGMKRIKFFKAEPCPACGK